MYINKYIYNRNIYIFYLKSILSKMIANRRFKMRTNMNNSLSKRRERWSKTTLHSCTVVVVNECQIKLRMMSPCKTFTKYSCKTCGMKTKACDKSTLKSIWINNVKKTNVILLVGTKPIVEDATFPKPTFTKTLEKCWID